MSYFATPFTHLSTVFLPFWDSYKKIDGKIGIVELARISLDWDWKLGGYEDIDKTVIYGAEYYSSFFFWNDKYKMFELTDTCKQEHLAFNQLALFEYLFANHYDVYGLIDQNLAINKTV